MRTSSMKIAKIILKHHNILKSNFIEFRLKQTGIIINSYMLLQCSIIKIGPSDYVKKVQHSFPKYHSIE